VLLGITGLGTTTTTAFLVLPQRFTTTSSVGGVIRRNYVGSHEGSCHPGWSPTTSTRTPFTCTPAIITTKRPSSTTCACLGAVAAGAAAAAGGGCVNEGSFLWLQQYHSEMATTSMSTPLFSPSTSVLVSLEEIGSSNTAATTITTTPFTDDIQYYSGPIPVMIGIFGIVIVILSILAVVSSKVDDAIVQTLRDFETTVQVSYPQKWQLIQQQLNDTITQTPDVDRDVVLLQIMEQFEQDDPQFMAQVRQRMKQNNPQK
jgi:hypothetical protein